jgi:fumarate reductase subunit C
VAVRGAFVNREDDRRYPLYVRKVPRTWWLRSGPYRRFAARELTSAFSAAFSAILLLFLFSLSRGRDTYEGFLRWLDSPAFVALSLVIFVAVLYHAGTWFRLTSRILLLRLGRRTVPPLAVIAALSAVWIVASGLIAYFHIWYSP